MDIGVYIRSKEQLKDVLTKGVKAKWIMFGDYGCYKRIPKINELRQIVGNSDMKFHYISPKVNTMFMENEYNQVLSLLDQGIAVSINDYGLLYKLHKNIKAEDPLYLGRLLTKSVNRWVWGAMHVTKEDEEAKAYFAQNNFYQEEKMDYFKKWNIKGIETSMFQNEEESLKKIKEEGFRVIGFVDHTIAAVSRACPMVRDKGISAADCNQLCMDQEVMIRPSNDEQKEKYPNLHFEGTVLMKKIEPTISWEGYEKVVFSYINEGSIDLMKKYGG